MNELDSGESLQELEARVTAKAFKTQEHDSTLERNTAGLEQVAAVLYKACVRSALPAGGVGWVLRRDVGVNHKALAQMLLRYVDEIVEHLGVLALADAEALLKIWELFLQRGFDEGAHQGGCFFP